jgi:GNAT superfamily N-acetyltransferase
MLLITNDLARRLEMAEAIDAAGCAEAMCLINSERGSAAKGIGGGVAVYCGSESPLTHSLGIGMHGPVTVEDIEELEEFFHERDAPVVVDLCPHAHPTLRDLLSTRGYRILEFVNVMARSLSADERLPNIPAEVQVRLAEPDEVDIFVTTVIGGFFGRDHLNEQEMELGATLFHMPCSSAFLAFLDGRAVGGGGMSIRNKVASLFSDATHASFRGRGVQSAVIHARLETAIQAGCDLIAAATTPGTESQRNYEKLGFQVAYTKVTMGLE